MILTLDIGNTNIKTALFDGKEMRYYWRMSTNIQKSSDEYGIVLVNLFQHVGVRPEEVEGIMISSVVPTINFTIEHMCQNYFGQTPLFVVPGIKTGINIRYENRANWAATESRTQWRRMRSTARRRFSSISVRQRRSAWSERAACFLADASAPA